jgi:hypothetical protein
MATKTIYTVYSDPNWVSQGDKRSKKDLVWREGWSIDVSFDTKEELDDYMSGKDDRWDTETGFNEIPTRYKIEKVTTELLDEVDSDLRYNVDTASKESLEESLVYYQQLYSKREERHARRIAERQKWLAGMA